MDANLAIRAADCVGCAYVNNLQVGQQYSLRLRCANKDGFGPYSMTTATPLEIPGAPSSINALPLSRYYRHIHIALYMHIHGNHSSYMHTQLHPISPVF